MKQLHYVGTQHVDKDYQTSKFVKKESTKLLETIMNSVVNVVTGRTCSGFIFNANCQKHVVSKSMLAMPWVHL